MSKKSKILFALLMSGSMAFCMSGILTFIYNGIDPLFISKWLRAFSISYGIAFPLVLVLAPLVNRLVRNIS